MGTMKFAEVVESTNNEVDFMKNVIAYITGINSAITCLDDLDDEYDVRTVGTDHIPTFRFSFNGNHILTISRGDKLSATSSWISIRFINNGNIIATNSVYYMYRGIGWSIDGLRQFKMSYMDSPGICILNITGYNTNQSFTVLFAESESSSYGACKTEASTYTMSNIFNISQCILYDNLNPVQGSFLSRFSYSSMPGYIDYVKSAVYVNNGLKQFALNCIYDCTTVTVGDNVPLDDGRYYAVGPHQIVKISDS